MTVRVMLTVAVLVAAMSTAGAQVATLVEDARWSSASAELPIMGDLSQRKALSVPELASAPAIDGQIDDAAWQNAAQTDTWMVATGETPAPVQTTVWVGTHRGTFYVGFRASEPNAAGIVATVTERGGPTWNDDSFELFIDGNLDQQTARQLVMNPLGTVTTLERGTEWQPDVTAAAQIADDAWMGEIALPMADLGATGTDFGINFCRERKAGGGNDLSCWSPTGGGFNQPDKFGLATLPGGWLNAFGVGIGVLGQNEVAATIANPTDTEQKLRARLVWWQGDGMALERTLGPFSIPAGGSREVTVGYDVQSSTAPVQLELSVLNETGRTVAERQTIQEIVSALEMAVSRRLLPAGEREVSVRGTLHLSPTYLERARLILAVFDEAMVLEARETIAPQDLMMRATLRLPELEPGQHSLHMVLKSGEGDDAQRIAEEKVTLEVLPRVPAQ